MNNEYCCFVSNAALKGFNCWKNLCNNKSIDYPKSPYFLSNLPFNFLITSDYADMLPTIGTIYWIMKTKNTIMNTLWECFLCLSRSCSRCRELLFFNFDDIILIIMRYCFQWLVVLQKTTTKKLSLCKLRHVPMISYLKINSCDYTH